MTGSGKTLVTTTLIRILAKLNQRVLVVSSNNSQIDSLLLNLKRSGATSFARITSSTNSVDPELKDHVKSPKGFKTLSEIEEFISTTKVYGISCL